MNGWVRIGLVLSLLWVPGAYISASISYGDYTKEASQLNKSCIDFAFLDLRKSDGTRVDGFENSGSAAAQCNEDYTKNFKNFQTEHNRLTDEAFPYFYAIPFAIMWIVGWVIAWIRRGFGNV